MVFYLGVVDFDVGRGNFPIFFYIIFKKINKSFVLMSDHRSEDRILLSFVNVLQKHVCEEPVQCFDIIVFHYPCMPLKFCTFFLHISHGVCVDGSIWCFCGEGEWMGGIYRVLGGFH